MLLLAWLGLLGVQSSAGCLLTALFFSGGDVGRILADLQSPFWVNLLVMAVGVLAVAWRRFPALPAYASRRTDVGLLLLVVVVVAVLLVDRLIFRPGLPL